MSELTYRQEKVLITIEELIEKNQFPPTSREVGKALGIKSSSTIHQHFCKLKEKGYIDWVAAKPRTLKVLKGA